MTSPNISTAIVDMNTAIYAGTILSRNIGRAYIAKAFESSSVDNRRW
jgi:hypothetical protein